MEQITFNINITSYCNIDNYILSVSKNISVQELIEIISKKNNNRVVESITYSDIILKPEDKISDIKFMCSNDLYVKFNKNYDASFLLKLNNNINYTHITNKNNSIQKITTEIESFTNSKLNCLFIGGVRLEQDKQLTDYPYQSATAIIGRIAK